MQDQNIIQGAYDAANYFWEVLHCLFWQDEEDDGELKLDINMFSEFCEHIKNTYQLFWNGETRNQMIVLLRPYQMLTEISVFPEFIDNEHNVIQRFAEIAIKAIFNILYVDSTSTAICEGPYVWYDFEKDTPQDVWNRLMAEYAD